MSDLAASKPAVRVTREQVHAIETEALKPQYEADRVECPLRHFFVPGVYAREIFLPAGTLATGRTHKFPQINILSKGDLSVSTPDGIVRVQAPFTIVSPAGTKRIVFAHKDCVFTTIIGTFETDLDTIEDRLTAASEADYQAFLAAQSVKEIP